MTPQTSSVFRLVMGALLTWSSASVRSLPVLLSSLTFLPRWWHPGTSVNLLLLFLALYHLFSPKNLSSPRTQQCPSLSICSLNIGRRDSYLRRDL